MKRFRGILAILVCASLSISSSPMLGETAPSPADQSTSQGSARPSNQSAQIQGDARILHALNRFTFGPRPGDLEAVRAMGLEKWFNRQLHPETLDQTNLDARLAQFPAMQGNPQDLLYRLPSNAVIRQIADGKASIPEGQGLRPIYDDELARVELRRQQREQKKQEQTSIAASGAMDSQAMNGSAMKDGAGVATEPTQPPQDQMSMNSSMSKPDQPPFDPSRVPGILALTAQQRMNRLAAMTQPEFDGFRNALKPKQRTALTSDLSPTQREFVAALENPQRVIIDELDAQRLTRDIYSNAQLQEVMTDFWLNHFNVFLHKNEATPYYLVGYERDVIRPHALGKFEDLLEATAHSPAMLLYLDNSSSMGPDSPSAERTRAREQISAVRNPTAAKKAPEGLNENYARELMELHTLGVSGGYTQADVTQVARILTGWTVDRPQRGGGFKFDETRHEPGMKKVLGKKFKQNGEAEGRELLHMLATRPATAQFISHKLAVRFVGDDPPKSMVDRMAKSYLKSGGDVSAVLKTLFHSPEFWSADAYRAKVKTPIEYVVSAARASNANFDNMQPLANALRAMGMPLYESVPPTGYSWQSSTWVSTGALVNRMNFALSLAANKLPGITVNWPPPADYTTAQLDEENAAHQSAASPTPDPAAEEQRLESLLVAGGVSETTRSAVLQQLDQQGSGNLMPTKPVAVTTRRVTPAQAVAALEKQDQLLAGLLLGSPEFQRR
ncbi:MAG: DUF1800 domain-containing protein [Terracidiphilus sp.]|jgi:uncharacterized protein (DUF1800 family)